MIITSTGYYYSGSGVITDLIKECDDIYVNDRFEVRLAHDPDGLSDLEYNLINNPNRHNGSTAIKRFLRSADKLDHVFFLNRYNTKVDPDFMRHTLSYLDEIICLQYPGLYHYDIWEKSKLAYIVNAVIKKITHDKKTILGKNAKNYFGIFDEEKFLESTQRYTFNVLNGLNATNLVDMFFEQLVPTTNISRYIRYFDDIKVIVVDRDPRDVFLLGKYKLNDKVMPKDITEFCDWYRWNRDISNRNELPKCAIKISFEDLIYFYDESVNKVLEHIGIDSQRHSRKRKYFNPDISIRNTQIWNRYPQLKEEADAIHSKLSEYCYSFPYSASATEGSIDIF